MSLPFIQEIRRRRNEVTVEIRKHKRDDTLQKRRNVPLQADSTGQYIMAIKHLVNLFFLMPNYVIFQTRTISATT